MSKVRSIIPVLIAAILLNACSIFTAKAPRSERQGQPPTYESRLSNRNNAVISGQVMLGQSLDHSMLVVAYPLEQERSQRKSSDQWVHTILAEAGEFMLYLPGGSYQIYTIIDFDDDNWFEENEVSGWYQNGEPVSVKSGEVTEGITIKSSAQPLKQVTFPETVGIRYQYNTPEYSWQNGQTITIYDAIFSKNNAKIGLWDPDQFFRAFGANIFLLEPYDPQKIPILFVHGINGSPQEWIPFWIRMDRDKYQMLLFYYPSGLRLELIANLLASKLLQLQQQLEFNKLCLVAHSMGGLVTQSMLTREIEDNRFPSIKLYITLATPWSGFESADDAVANSPVILPSWVDVASRSIFIKKLLKRDLPHDLPYYLFYGKHDAVSQGKALDERAYKLAWETFGFEATHQSILTRKEVFKQFQMFLDKHLP